MSKRSRYSVMVTRPDPQGSELCQLIESLGGKAIYFPTIDIAPPADSEALTHAISILGEQEWLIFISPQAVYTSIVAIRRIWPQFPPQVKFAAVGAGTAHALHGAGYEVALHPTTEWSSEGLLAMPEFQSLRDKPIAIIRGMGGRGYLEQTLTDRGARVTSVITYQRVLPTLSQHVIDQYLSFFKQHLIDLIICASFESVNNLKKLIGESGFPYLKAVPLLVPSERIKVLAEDLGFQTIWVARNASHKAMLESMVERL